MTVIISDIDIYSDALTAALIKLGDNPRTYKMRVHTAHKNGILHRTFKFTKKRHTKG